MKKIKMLAATAAIALIGATSASAQQAVVGAIVPPRANLIAVGYIGLAEALLSGSETVGANTAANSYTLGTFMVQTNVEHWNVRITSKNGGLLLDRNGTALKTNTSGTQGLIGATTNGSVFICPTYEQNASGAIVAIAACAAPSTVQGAEDTDAATTPTTIVPADVALEAANTPTPLAQAIGGSDAEYFRIAGAVDVGFDIRSRLTGTRVTALAGVYTETFTISLIPTF